MKLRRLFPALRPAEWVIWIGSMCAILLSFFCQRAGNSLSLVASLVGACALIFVAKGAVIGQVLTVVFAILYGMISFRFQYYGEMITYLGMTAPIALLAVISWLRHPYRDTAEVAVGHLSLKSGLVMLALAILTTALFYVILRALGTARLLWSTISITTSFLASYLTFLRNPLYALAYAANDVILTVLWILAARGDAGYFPMVVCFLVFLVNDLYGLYNWRRMRAQQEKGTAHPTVSHPR